MIGFQAVYKILRYELSETPVLLNCGFNKLGHLVKTPHAGGTLKKGVTVTRNGRYMRVNKSVSKEEAFI